MIPLILAVYMIIKDELNCFSNMYLFFTRLQNATEVDATCSSPPDPVVATLRH